jgi:hypothetical protein
MRISLQPRRVLKKDATRKIGRETEDRNLEGIPVRESAI